MSTPLPAPTAADPAAADEALAAAPAAAPRHPVGSTEQRPLWKTFLAFLRRRQGAA